MTVLYDYCNIRVVQVGGSLLHSRCGLFQPIWGFLKVIALHCTALHCTALSGPSYNSKKLIIWICLVDGHNLKEKNMDFTCHFSLKTL